MRPVSVRKPANATPRSPIRPRRIRWRPGLAALALVLAGCVSPDAMRLAGCAPGAPYAGPALRAAPPASAFPTGRIDWTATLPAGVRERFDQAWTEGVAATDATVASVVIARLDDGTHPSGVWSADMGPSDEPRTHWWASVGKMATASVILQMAEAGDLSLDDPIERWLPGFPGAASITVDHLLSHTGGVSSFERDPTLRERHDYIAPDRLIAASAERGLDHCPGTDWLYSNTGYVMLARIAERIDEVPFARVVERRVIEPLGLRSARVLGPSTDPASLPAPVGRPEVQVPYFAMIGGAAPIAGDAHDMVRLLEGWMTGALIDPDARNAALARLHPMFGSKAVSYGRGVVVVDVPGKKPPTLWIGHTGGSPDAKAVLIYDVRRRTYLGLLLNTDADGERLALSLLRALD